MASPRNDRRTSAKDVAQHQDVTYPAGILRFPRVVERQTCSNQVKLPDGGTPHPDSTNFPTCILTELASSPGDNTDTNWTLTYDAIPGPITIRIDEIQDTGIPSLIATRKISPTADYVEGEFMPAAINVTSVSLTDSNGNCTVTLATNHELPPRAWVTFLGTNSTPALQGLGLSGSGNFRIISVPAENQVVITPTAPVTVAGTAAGTMQAMNRIVREIRQTENVNYLIRVDSMIAVPDVTSFNEDLSPIEKEYSFPDYLQGLTFYKNDSESVSGGATEYSLSLSSDGSLLPFFQNGYRGPCQGHRLRLFSSGPPASAYLSPYKPKFIAPSSGSYAIAGQSLSIQVSTGGTANAISHSYKAGSIQPCITGGHSAPTDTIGTGDAECKVRLLPSSPARFFQGDIITLMEMPQKLGAALWQTIVWQLTVPYTSGLPPADFTYSTNPAVYPSGSPIATNSPVGLTSPSAFSISPAIPGGMSFNASTGVITGTPGAATVPTLYTITCTDTTAKTAYLIVTIT